MKLQKQVAYVYKGEKKYKYVIVIPQTVTEELKWKEGDELETKTEGKKLELKKK